LKDKEKLAQEELLKKQRIKKRRQKNVENNVSFHT
jgi:hypothetical protein